MAYKALNIAKKLIVSAKTDEANGGELLTNLKLQKLLYYEQGFHLAAFDTPLFEEDIEAWMYGPVVPSVYYNYESKGSQPLECNEEPIHLTPEEETLFYQVYDAFKDFSAYGLMRRTHDEKPWRDSTPHNKGTVISQQLMTDFFKTQME